MHVWIAKFLTAMYSIQVTSMHWTQYLHNKPWVLILQTIIFAKSIWIVKSILIIYSTPNQPYCFIYTRTILPCNVCDGSQIHIPWISFSSYLRALEEGFLIFNYEIQVRFCLTSFLGHNLIVLCVNWWPYSETSW